MNDERCQKPLLNDIWQFHQAEKLYTLRIIKEILTQTCSNSDSDTRHFDVYQDIFIQLDNDGQLKESLIKQFESLIEVSPPNKDKYYSSGKITSKNFMITSFYEMCYQIYGKNIVLKSSYFSDTIQAWTHFNLRQQCELLQIILLYFHRESSVKGQDVLNLLKLFSTHRFGSKKIVESVDKSLVESIGNTIGT